MKHHSIVCKFTAKIHAHSIVKQKQGTITLLELRHIVNLPSRTMALQELSMSVGRLEPRHPLRNMIALRKREKPFLVRMYVIASVYDSFFFSAILLASCFIVRVADGPAPPMQENTSETK